MTYSEAKRAGRTHYLATRPCIHGHPPGLRRVDHGHCMACIAHRKRRAYQLKRFRERQVAYVMAWMTQGRT